MEKTKVYINNEVIQVDHLLHGYQNGHSLISSSIDLNPEAKRTLLIMSDMSGQSMQLGFEEYITGYPIKEINSYAIAKTWYAPEMKRPGCVWTHTILIKFSDLIKIDNGYALLSLFKRPDGINAESYSYKLEISTDFKTKSSLDPKEYDFEFLKALTSLLYSTDQGSVLIQEQNSKRLEKLILTLWLQQWPRLKRNFSFCTGSISPRSLGGKNLDLQVVPLGDNITNDTSYFVFRQDHISDNRIEKWSETICEDLFSPSLLRRFLNTSGSDVKPIRTSFKSLVKIYDLLSENHDQPNLQNLVQVLGEEFPMQDDAISLKNFILDSNKDQSASLFKEEDLLYELSVTKFFNSFNEERLRIKERILNFYKLNHSFLLDILDKALNQEINPLGIDMLMVLANTIEESDLDAVNRTSRKLVFFLTALNPNLAYFKSFWSVPQEQQKENFNLLLKHNFQAKLNWQRIVSMILENGFHIDLELTDKIEFNIVGYVLDWYALSSKSSLTHDWQNLLIRQPKEVLDWLDSNDQISFKGVDLVIRILNPNSSVVVKNGSLVWLKILKNREIERDKLLDIRLKAFVLALALNNPDKNGLELLEKSLETVYKAVLDDALDYDSWKRIEKHTRELKWWDDWDKARKLTYAIVDNFPVYRFSAKYFDSLIVDKSVAKKFVKHYKSI